MNTNLQALRQRKKDLADVVARKLMECREFLLDYGLLKANLGDVLHITDELRRELWYKFIENTDPIVQKFTKDLIPTFAKQEADVLKNLRQHPSPPSKAKLTPEQDRFIDLWLFDTEKWRKEFSEVGKPHITNGVITGGISALDAVDAAIPFSVAETETARFIKNQTFKFSAEINKTTTAALKTQFATALQEGEAITEVTKRVQHVFTIAEKTRATRIAQTEMIGAVNKGALEGNRQSGVVWGTQWLGSLDNLIRKKHEAMTKAGEAVALGDTFSNGLEYPGDQGGNAAEVVNCRCTTKPLTKKPRQGEQR